MAQDISPFYVICEESAQLIEKYLASKSDGVRSKGQKDVRLSLSILEEAFDKHG